MKPVVVFQVPGTKEEVGRRNTWLIPQVGWSVLIDNWYFRVVRVGVDYDRDIVLVDVEDPS